MPPKKDNRFEKNWTPPEKEWFHPEMTPEEREKHRHDFEQEGDDFSLAKALSVVVVKRAFGFSRWEKASRFIMEIVEDIWMDGYVDAKKGYEPNHGAVFKTFLYGILERKARKVRRKLFSRTPPKIGLNIVTVRSEGIYYGQSECLLNEHGEIEPRFTRFLFDFRTCDFSFLPCGLKLPDVPKHVEKPKKPKPDEPRTPFAAYLAKQERFLFLQRVGKITDWEFQHYGRDNLPESYKRLNNLALKNRLSELDTGIVEMLTDEFRPKRQKDILKRFGITKYFYAARIRAILRRLNLPDLAPEIRVESAKRKQKERNKLEIAFVEEDRSFVFSPPQRIKVEHIVDGERRFEWDMREFRGCPLVENEENEEILRWHGDSDEEPEDFAGTSVELKPFVNELAAEYAYRDSEHWELIDDSWFE